MPLSELIHDVMPHFYPDFPVDLASVIVVDRGEHVLNGF